MACAMKVASLIRRNPLYGDETALSRRRERNCGLFARTPPVRLQFVCSIAPPCRILGESL